MSHTHLRLGDQAHAAHLLESRLTAMTDVLRTLEAEVSAHGAGFTGAAGASLQAALGAWLTAAEQVPASLASFAQRLLTAEAAVHRSQQEQAEIFHRVARSLGPS